MNFYLVWQEWLVVASVVALISLLISVIRGSGFDRALAWSSFFVYLTTVSYLTFLPFPTKQTSLSLSYVLEQADLVPLRPLLKSWSIVQENLATGNDLPLQTFLWNNIGNLLVLVPLALFSYYFFKRKPWQALLICVGSSLLIELLQAIFCLYFGVMYRVVDINDVLLNSIGALLALLLATLLRNQGKMRR